MYEEFRNRALKHGTYMGQIMRNQSNVVVNATWMNSTSTYPVMVKDIDFGLPPTYDTFNDYEEPFWAHFETKSVYNAGGNEPTYYLTFAPGVIAEHPEIKVGSYVNIPSVDGVCQYWLIVHLDDDDELIKTQILKTTWTLQWVTNNVIYKTLCAIRNGTSENIGIETVGQISTVDSDMFIWLPTNIDTQTIGYDTRFLISDAGRMPPLVWKVSRVRDVGPTGITRLSLSQDLYNPSTDNAVLGIANYYGSSIPLESVSSELEEDDDIIITYNGTKPIIKVGGSKIFTADLLPTDTRTLTWSVNDGINTYTTTTTNYALTTTNRTLELKVAKNYNLIGTLLTIQAEDENNVVGEVKVEVV